MPEVTVRLKRREARRVASGHAWIFSNEVAEVEPREIAVGICRIVDDSDRFIGRGYYNRHSLICSRLLTRDPDLMLDADFFRARLETALNRRRGMYEVDEAYRGVYGEADGLPGLVVDCYPAAVVVQVSTCGMELLQPLWEPGLRDLCGDRPLVFRNDIAARRHEGLPQLVGYPDGLPDENCYFSEAGATVAALPYTGQNTGYFLDQRENRVWSRRLARGSSLLDCFAYTGAWGLSLLQTGAERAVLVDRSQTALAAARNLAERTGVETHCRFETAPVVDWLRQAATDGETFDLVIVDPPPFIPTRKDAGPGRRSYLGLYRLALRVTAPGGVAVLCSRSYHLPEADFERVTFEAAARERRSVQHLWRGGAGPDHPEPMAMPETRYLKCAFLAVS